MKKFSLFAAALLAIIPLSGGFVRASAVESAPTDFENRRAVLVKVFELSKSELTEVQERLLAVERPTDDRLALAYDTFAYDLADYLDLIESRMKELNSSYITFEGVRVTADNFKKWREAVFDPSIQQVFDFLILQQATGILEVAETRYEKIAADILKLKEGGDVAKADALSGLLSQAGERLENARVLRDAGYEMFVTAFRATHNNLAGKFERIDAHQGVPKDDASLLGLVTTILTDGTDEKAQTTLSDIDLSLETVQTLMKRAVDEIATTYKIFLQMRDLVYQE